MTKAMNGNKIWLTLHHLQ